MSVRLKLALTVFVTGLVTALGVVVTVALGFQQVEHETTYRRADAFLGRVVTLYDDLFDLYDRRPDEVTELLRTLLLFEPDTQLYLLAADGRVLTHTGQARLPADFKVTLGPVRQAAAAAQGRRAMPYVMGDDPERMDADAVVAARALSRAVIRSEQPVAGYLYLVGHKPALPGSRLEAWRSTLSRPALATVAAVVALTTLVAAWIIVSVTRPLRRLSDEVDRAGRDGLGAAAPALGPLDDPAPEARDEFGRLRAGFRAMLAKLRMQWDTLQQLDRFRREGVSNLSHDLRSPLTATAACLETLEQRWQGDAARDDDRRLVEVALRNARNAAQLVRSLGDLAQLDEPAFRLRTDRLDVGEVLDDIALRFAERAAEQGVTLSTGPRAADAPPPVAVVDVELFERAVANLVDNALKFTPAGGSITLDAHGPTPPLQGTVPQIEVCVADTGPGIADDELPRLFDRYYRSRDPASQAAGGKGLGLAIVQRIAELHRGSVQVAQREPHGTRVTIALPCG